MATRPTSDRLRETVFNILAARIDGARFADLYAGTGAVGIEALSRGAGHVTFVENAASALAALRGNLAALGIQCGFTLEPRSAPAALSSLARRPQGFGIVYLDPPWEDGAAYQKTLALLSDRAAMLLAPEAIVVAEHGRRGAAVAETYGPLTRYRVHEQGDAALSFYRVEEKSPS